MREHGSIINKLELLGNKNNRFGELKQINQNKKIKLFDNFNDATQEIIENYGILIAKGYSSTLRSVGYNCKVSIMQELFAYTSSHLVFKVCLVFCIREKFLM